jgi:hypothetical protein
MTSMLSAILVSILCGAFGACLVISARAVVSKVQLLRAFKLSKPAVSECAHHELAVINVFHFEAGGVLAVQHTAVLKRCAGCGVHITPMLSGHWTLEEMLRKESSVSEFEKIVGSEAR